MPRFITKYSGLLSATGIAIAVVVGIVIGSGLTFAIISMLWGRPDLWPLHAG